MERPDNETLVMALRNCAKGNAKDEGGCVGCPYNDMYPGEEPECLQHMLFDAADAIEGRTEGE